MRYLPLILALAGFGLFLIGVLSLSLTLQPTLLNQMATYIGLGMVLAVRAFQLVGRFVSDGRGQSEPVKPSAPAKTVPPALAWGILGVILLAGIISVCRILFFSK
jgi:hypothetical protein